MRQCGDNIGNSAAMQQTPRRQQQMKYIGISSQTYRSVERTAEDIDDVSLLAGQRTSRPTGFAVTRPRRLRANVIRGAVKFADRRPPWPTDSVVRALHVETEALH